MDSSSGRPVRSSIEEKKKRLSFYLDWNKTTIEAKWNLRARACGLHPGIVSRNPGIASIGIVRMPTQQKIIKFSLLSMTKCTYLSIEFTFFETR